MTEKKLRQHLHRIWFHWARLQTALKDAHHADVIKYPKDLPYADTCCSHLWLVRLAVEKFTKDQLAETIQREIRSKV